LGKFFAYLKAEPLCVDIDCGGELQALPKRPTRFRLITGQVDVTDVATRVLFPTPQLDRWSPFVRFAETIATFRKRTGDHRHRHEEVMLYVLEGAAVHSQPGGAVDTLSVGSVLLLTAPAEAAHAAIPGKGRTSRWISIVMELPEQMKDGTPTYRFTRPSPLPIGADGAMVTNLVGPRAQMPAGSGLECSDILFVEDGTSFVEVGHSRRGIVYAVSGEGRIEDAKIEVGEAALVERMGGIALHGTAGFRAILATAPT
jgi:redox-sensitive bicupin YhaK (pirin superfamily)